MVDGVLLLVDAFEGPMPQTRFVTQKALKLGLQPIVVVNKIDRPGARPEWVVNQTFDLFDRLGATDAQLDFPVVYASGWTAGRRSTSRSRRPGSPPEGGDMKPLFDTILAHVPEPGGRRDRAAAVPGLRARLSSYLGRLGIGRIRRGTLRAGAEVAVLHGPLATGRDSARRRRSARCSRSRGSSACRSTWREAGDIVLVTGIDDLTSARRSTDVEAPEALPLIKVDEPTLAMTFQVNTSPLAGREGKYVTSRNLRERLNRELLDERGAARRGHRRTPTCSRCRAAASCTSRS